MEKLALQIVRGGVSPENERKVGSIFIRGRAVKILPLEITGMNVSFKLRVDAATPHIGECFNRVE